MCLYIDKLHYNSAEKKYISKKAACDLKVAKLLYHIAEVRIDPININDLNQGFKQTEQIGYYTPIMNIKINFPNGKCIQKANGNGAHLEKRITDCVQLGIHSLKFDTIFKSNYAKLEANNIYLHYAIIPKGTNYFIGDKGDVVSENLLVFETNKDFENYCENNEVKSLA